MALDYCIKIRFSEYLCTVMYPYGEMHILYSNQLWKCTDGTFFNIDFLCEYDASLDFQINANATAY